MFKKAGYILPLAALVILASCVPRTPTVSPSPTDTPSPLAAPLPTATATSLPEGASLPTPSEPLLEVNRIAYVGLDGEIYIIRPDGSDVRRLTESLSNLGAFNGSLGTSGDVLYNWPTWSPDGTKIAFSAFSTGPDGAAALYTIDVEAGTATKLYDNPPEVAGRLVATNAPHYIYWSPDSQNIAFLAPTVDTLALLVVKGDGSEEARSIFIGAPSYLAWAPDGQSLLSHLGSNLFLVEVGGEPSTAQLPPSSIAFRVPAWSPDGQRIAFIEDLEGGGRAIKVADALGQNDLLLAPIEGTTTFAWSPTSDRVAFTQSVDPTGPAFSYNGIDVFKVDTGEQIKVADDEVVAFFWSPDGEQIAYVAANRALGSLSWFVVDKDGETKKKLVDFLPTGEFLFSFLGYFDQYALSNSPWSPDSRSLVYAGREVGTDGQGLDQIFVLSVDASFPLRVIAEGTLAFWSPN